MVAGKVIAESTHTLLFEDEGYPPVHSIPQGRREHVAAHVNDALQLLPLQGDCSYFSIVRRHRVGIRSWDLRRTVGRCQRDQEAPGPLRGRVDDFLIPES